MTTLRSPSDARRSSQAAIAKFRGTFDQTPPVFSAKNIDGERSYDLARAGASVTGRGRAARPRRCPVTVKRLELLSFDGDTARLEMQVTAGFYVRSLAHDLGAALECGAVLAALRRTRSGEFGLDRAVPLADVLQAPRESLAGRLVPFREPAAGIAVGDAAVGDPAGTPQERRGNGAQRPRGAARPPSPDRPAAGPEGDLVRPGKAGQERQAFSRRWWFGKTEPRPQAISMDGSFWGNIIRLQAMLISPHTAAW